MGRALYRNYRPKSLSEVVGQEQITTTLQHALKTGKLSHAYLFTGPRGVGKTSIARILAHEINGLEYGDDSVHLDIIEIDAASNRRIDEIRDLRDKVNVAPTSAKYKVYIIDEVHMLTREAFNALLKTLEEPPAHVVFILATTEAHKLPETIISRTQRFTFRPYPLEQVGAHLKDLAQKEKIDITDEALALIAAYGEGSFRDSISLLDQTRGAGQKVDADYVRSLIGVPTDEAIVGLYDAMQSHNAATAYHLLTQLRNQGFSSAQTAKSLGAYIRARAVEGHAAADDFTLLPKLLDVPAAHDADAFLELALLEYALAPLAHTRPAPAMHAHETTALPTKPAEKPESKPPTKAVEKKPEKVESATPPQVAEPPREPEPTAAQPVADTELWPKVLDALKSKHNTLYGIARMARAEFADDGVILYLKFAFHQKRLAESKNHTILISIMKQISGRNLALRCELDEAGSTPATKTSPDNTGTNPVAAISNIFGGAELLES